MPDKFLQNILEPLPDLSIFLTRPI